MLPSFGTKIPEPPARPKLAAGDVTITLRDGAQRRFFGALDAVWRRAPWRLVITPHDGGEVIFMKGVISSIEVTSHVR